MDGQVDGWMDRRTVTYSMKKGQTPFKGLEFGAFVFCVKTTDSGIYSAVSLSSRLRCDVCVRQACL